MSYKYSGKHLRENSSDRKHSSDIGKENFYSSDAYKNMDEFFEKDETEQNQQMKEESYKEKFEKRERKRKEAAVKRTVRLTNTIRTVVMTLFIFGVALFLIFGKRPKVSTEENRNLATFPKFSFSSYFSGEYTAGVSNYYNDTVPLRSKFKTMIAGIESSFGLDYGGSGDDAAVLIGNSVKTKDDKKNLQTEETKMNQTATEAETVVSDAELAETTQEATEEVIDDNGEIDNNILVWNKRALMLFGGSYTKAEEYANTVNSYKSRLGDSVNVYSMIAPTAGQFYIPEKYQDLTNSETDNIDYINERLDSSVKIVDVYNTLLPHVSEEIYARTDHHWLPLGAFYAAEEFAKTAGTDFAPLSSYQAITKEGYVGTMYGYTGSDIIKNNPEDFTYYVPSNQYQTYYYDNDLTNGRTGNLLINLDNVDPVSWYLVFMGGDDRITHINTDCTNGRTLVMIKDSYGNALVPCFTSSFTDIYVIDMRYFNNVNIIDFVNTVGCTDLLFAMDTYSAVGSNCDDLATILNQSTECDITARLADVSQ